MTWVLGVACACVTCCSSMASATYPGMEADFGVGREVCTLSISLFVAGLGVGPCKLVSERAEAVRKYRDQRLPQCSWVPRASSSVEAESCT